MDATVGAVGEQLRDWRQRRRLSQLDLACEAGVSTRHLSFVETAALFVSHRDEVNRRILDFVRP